MARTNSEVNTDMYTCISNAYDDLKGLGDDLPLDIEGLAEYNTNELVELLNGHNDCINNVLAILKQER